MGLYVNPGNQMFQESLNGLFYVDKTRLAVFMNERICTPDKAVCVSRPRRFGKSFDADMLVAYYTRGADSRAQFANLDISKHPSFEEHLNKHDVIKLDMLRMAAVGGGVDAICGTIHEKVLSELRAGWPEAASSENLFEALEVVAASKGSGFIFVVDEWDCVMRLSSNDALQRSYLDFLRNLFKGAAYVDAVYMTGILPIKKYGQHSALNIFTEYSMTHPDELAVLTGFNADEVGVLCREFDADVDEIERWYDGYRLGLERRHVYNPRSVAGAIRGGVCRSFWTSTETYESLQAYIDMDFDGLATDLVAMLGGQRVAASVDRFENDMTSIRNKNDCYALLVHLGYLGYDQVERTVFMPNEEIRREFAVSLETGSRPELARLVRDSRELQRRTLAGDSKYVADAVERAHSSAAGPHYYNDEQALRAAVKLAFIWSIDDYLRVDELPGGRGYADIAFIPKPSSGLPPMLVELKWGKEVDAAIAQIHARSNPKSLHGLSGECVLVGITYDKDTCEHCCEIERVVLQ